MWGVFYYLFSQCTTCAPFLALGMQDSEKKFGAKIFFRGRGGTRPGGDNSRHMSTTLRYLRIKSVSRFSVCKNLSSDLVFAENRISIAVALKTPRPGGGQKYWHTSTFFRHNGCTFRKYIAQDAQQRETFKEPFEA